MDQARDPVTGRPATPPVDVTQTSGDPEAIADDIRETRAELSDTISQIGDKLDPRHLVDDAKDALFSAGRDAGTSMLDQVKDSSILDTIKDNPLPAMAVGLSVAWFLSKVGENESDRYRAEQYRVTGDPYYAPRGYRYGSEYRGYGDPRPLGATYGVRGNDYGSGGSQNDESLMDKASDALDTAKDKASDALDTAKDKASNAVDAAKDKASDLTDSASRTAHGARDRASGAGQSLKSYERRAESWLDDQMRRNPLAVGAVALAAGALVGLSVPETDVEHRAFGEQARAARGQLQSAAQDATEQVTSAAQDVANEAADKAKTVGKEAESKAKDVGAKAESRADDVADSAKGDIQDAKNKAAGKVSSGSSTSSGVDTGTSIDLSTAPVQPLAGSTAPPTDLATPTKTVDLSDDKSSSKS